MGQWSKFVRPGFYRVDATEKPANGVSLSAYKGDTSVVLIVVNTNNSASTLNISLPGSNITPFAKYTTSASKTLASDGNVNASNGSLSAARAATAALRVLAIPLRAAPGRVAQLPRAAWLVGPAAWAPATAE